MTQNVNSDIVIIENMPKHAQMHDSEQKREHGHSHELGHQHEHEPKNEHKHEHKEDHQHGHDAHEHDHDHGHGENDLITSLESGSLDANLTGENTSFDPNIAKTVELCAEQGWRVNFYFKDGTTFIGGFITSGDFDKGAVVTERMGERHLKPRLIFFRDLESVEADWTGK